MASRLDSWTGAADDGWEEPEGGAVALCREQVNDKSNMCGSVSMIKHNDYHHGQDSRLRRQGPGRADQLRGVREHHWQVGRAGPQEDGGSSLKGSK